MKKLIFALLVSFTMLFFFVRVIHAEPISVTLPGILGGVRQEGPAPTKVYIYVVFDNYTGCNPVSISISTHRHKRHIRVTAYATYSTRVCNNPRGPQPLQINTGNVMTVRLPGIYKPGKYVLTFNGKVYRFRITKK